MAASSIGMMEEGVGKTMTPESLFKRSNLFSELDSVFFPPLSSGAKLGLIHASCGANFPEMRRTKAAGYQTHPLDLKILHFLLFY